MRGSRTRVLTEDAFIAASYRKHREFAAARKVPQACSPADEATVQHGGACPNCGYDTKLSARELEALL